ncbi:MAG: hypothetical protein KAS71_15210 [Bacteroidales bacterium]|nr:hypothetical protein [Bacteroidales bacterium]
MSIQLSNFFSGIGAKKLSEVEVEPDISNQHEFNGVTALRDIFGTQKISFQGRFIYLSDDEEQILEDTGNLTWYDSRIKDPTRSAEFRLYYSPNKVIDGAEQGDLAVIGRISDDKLAILIAPKGSTSEKQLLWLFGLEDMGSSFVLKDLTDKDIQLNYAGQYIISSFGFEIQDTAPDYLDELIKRFSKGFPTTSEFSDYARSTIGDASAVDEPDTTLLNWMERELLLFRTLENHFVSKKLQKGFGDTGTDVDDFISYSLSVQNRRKSRAGYAFENHLAVLFDSNNILYSRGCKTERNNKPDFLFPGISQYNNIGFATELLTMLGVKTTAKDRWRQVLSEADRIENKHLITLEPAISKNQTDEMIAKNLQLVIPKQLQATYTEEQQSDMINLYEFIRIIKDNQNQNRN